MIFTTMGDNTEVSSHCVKNRIHHRGPDAFHTITNSIKEEHTFGQFAGYTLHFQGEITTQPLTDDDSNILLWNGEVFGGIETNQENDGLVILNALRSCNTYTEVLLVFANILGPWSFIYWQEKQKRLWFGRDIFGRRSLLFHAPSNHCCFSLSSVADDGLDSWKEVPATGIYCMDYKSEILPVNCEILHFPYILKSDSIHDFCKIKEICADTKLFNNTVDKENTVWQDFHVTKGKVGLTVPFSNFNDTLPNGDHDSRIHLLKDSEITTDSLDRIATKEQFLLRDKLIDILGKAVKVRVERQSHLCHDCITACLKSRKFHALDTLKQLELNEKGQQHSLSKRSVINNIHAETNPDPKQQFRSEALMTVKGDEYEKGNCDTEALVGDNCPSNRVKDCHSDCHTNNPTLLRSVERCGHSRVAILFSGGIDSLVIAALADRFVPADEPIDLLNVAFEQHQKSSSGMKNHKGKEHPSSTHSPFDVPDRITGKAGLNQLNSERSWNFVEIDITLDHLQEARKKHVKELVYPLNTVLDDSIGCAIWFAARGEGNIRRGDDVIPYKTTARVVLVGMGADEQLVGYSRHRVIYKTKGLAGLVAEIKMEIERISARNLGRDDRIISDHSKEARFPFLDENVVSFLNELPILQKANLELPRGIGEKFLLRLAAVKLGLGDSSLLPKRAIQFGSRIAKIENKKEKASDVCERL